MRRELVSRLGEARAQRYLTSGVRIVEDGDGVRLEAPDAFTLDMIERRIGAALRDTVRELRPGTDAPVTFKVVAPRGDTRRTAGRGEPERGAPSAPERDRAPTHARRAPSAAPGLDAFVVGSSNELAHAAVTRAIAPAGPGASVLVHGVCGVGKTHLLNAAAQRFRATNPGARARVISGEAFTGSFVQAVRTNTVVAFERRFRDLDLLCVDDVHLIAGKEKTQHELLTIFDTLALKGARIVMASDAPPHEIASLHASLASRLSGGVVARIDTPAASMAPALIRSLAQRHGVTLDDQGVGVLAERIGLGRGATGRDVEGAVVQVQAVVSLLGNSSSGHATLSHVARAMDLRGLSAQRAALSAPIPASLAVGVVCEELGVSRDDLAGSGRHKRVVLTRELCVHACKTLTTASYPEIARAMGRPNHSSVITAHKRLLARFERGESADVLGVSVPVEALGERLCAAIRSRRGA